MNENSLEALKRATASTVRQAAAVTPTHALHEVLQQTFGTPFVFVDPKGREAFRVPETLPDLDWEMLQTVCRSFASRQFPEIAWEVDPIAVLAIPLMPEDGTNGDTVVALAPFVTRLVQPQETLTEAAQETGADPDRLTAWAVRQTPWSPQSLLSVAALVLDRNRLRRQIAQLHLESDELSNHLASTYEEISLLHRLTNNLRISKNHRELTAMALEWLEEVIPAEGLAGLLFPKAYHPGDQCPDAEPILISRGEFSLDTESILQLAEMFDVQSAGKPVVRNTPANSAIRLSCGDVRQLVAVAICEGEKLFGYLAVANHREGLEFGSVEGNLMQSVATIIGIHSGNLVLYREQADLLEGVIRALTSAIDAKDEYTCGHSDRVARMSVRLAMELGYSQESLPDIYLAGLLHDIGKIGVVDAVLRKPGKLDDDEFEHIKRHPTIGHRILCRLKKLEDILPGILHHHESWDGRGYPDRLAGDEIPMLARIVAVADSYDAMSSNRPYRNRLPEEKIDEIFRSNSGRQWDPQVVEAFFRARADMARIADGDEDAFRPQLYQS
ncbi:hypothetical protein JCM19992_32210 [Thermostilla marina]